MTEEIRVVRVSSDAHRPPSRGTPGYERDIWQSDGANNMRGPTESRPATPDDLADALGCQPGPAGPTHQELTPAQKAVADAISDLITALITEVAVPYVRRIAIPAAKRWITQAIGSLRYEHDKAHELVPTPRTDEVEQADSEPAIVLTGEQFRQNVLLTMAAEQWAAQQKKLLANAVISNDKPTPELRQAINLVLEGRIHQLGEDTIGLLGAYFRESRLIDTDGGLVREPDEPGTMRRLAESGPAC